MTSRWILALALGVAASFGVAPDVLAQETTTFTYDAKGRVVNVQRSGGPSGGAATAYTYDAASNRTNKTTSGSPNGNDNGSGNGATTGTPFFIAVTIPGYGMILVYE